MLRRVVIGFLVVFICLAPVVGRAVLESNRALAAARVALTQGEILAAFDRYGEAIRWDFYGNKYADVAVAEFDRALRDERRSPAEKIRGFELLVSALRSGRHPFSAFRAERADVLAWARENLAILRGPNLYQVSPAAAQKVNPPFQLLSHIFFWGWVVLGLQLCFRGFDSAARPQWGEMKRRTLPLGIVYGLWLLSLRLA